MPTIRPKRSLPASAEARRSYLADPSTSERYQTRLGSLLTLVTVSSILRSADLGDLQPLADLLDEVREKDGHLQSVLSKRELAVAGAPWELRPREGLSKRRSDKTVELCWHAIENVQSFSAVLADMQSAVYHGRYVGEVIYERDGRYWLPRRIETVHRRRLRYSTTDWRLRIWDTDPASRFSLPYGIPVDEINALIPGKLIVHAPRIRGGYPTREGLGRTAVWFSGVFKAFSWRDILALCEQHGRPLRWGEYSTGKDGQAPASAEDVDELEEAIESLSSGITAVLPNTTKLNVYAPPTSDLQRIVMNLCDNEVSKAVLGGTLTTDPGVRGARSLGETQKDEQLIFARWDANCVAETLREYLFKPLLEINGLDRRDAPTMHFTTDPPDSQDKLADRYAKLVGAGLDIDQVHVRDRFGIPEPTKDTPLMVPRVGPRGGQRAEQDPAPKD